MLVASHLRKQYATTLAVDDVSFEVRRGEIFGLLGPNGAGKTTSIRILLKIIEPEGGEVLLDGERFGPAMRNRVGYLPEERGLYRKSRVLDVILYLAELRGMVRKQARNDALRWLDRLGISSYAGRKTQELSKGNQQKIQFVTAIIHDPELLVLDEPFSGLDPVNQILFKDIFLELKERGKAIVFSTHQMDQAEKLSDTLCLINKGRVVLDGSVRDVKRRYGTNSLHLEFDGDGKFLTSVQGVHRALLYENSAELELFPAAKTADVIAQINPCLELRKVELQEPSLQSIFLHIVGGDHSGSVPQTPEAP
jgi:ABC-2 type transport system ATP-binding protein